MRTARLVGTSPSAIRLARRLRLAVSALALAVIIDLPRAFALDLDGVDGLITETVASRDRQRVWDNSKRYGAESIDERDRTFAKPEGIRAGSFLIFPEVGAAVTFDDNIFTRDFEKRSDWRSAVEGGIKFQSQLPRHMLDFSLEGKVVNYAEYTDLDYANVRAKLESALHFDNAHTLSASFLSGIEHEERDDPSYPLTARGPIQVFHNRASVGITRDVGRLYGTLSATAESWDFDDAIAVNGDLLDQDSRNTTTYSSQLKFGYRFSPGYTFVGKVRGLHDLNEGDIKTDRDAWGYEALAGLAFETNPLLRWRILGGFGVRDYEQDDLANLNTTLMQADVQWLPTQRLTIYGTLSRQILDVTDIAASGVVQSSAKLSAEYEIYHNLVMNAGIELRSDVFQGTDRQDELYSIRAGLDYYFTKNWLFTFGYEYQVRDSTDDALDMHRNRFRIGAKLHF
ncbi:MAG: outer membrane beta-barrel protein [Hyphomicrobium sp.]|nr:outer membrane beta-barrel protein [Hyphomicrobium sp.]